MQSSRVVSLRFRPCTLLRGSFHSARSLRAARIPLVTWTETQVPGIPPDAAAPRGDCAGAHRLPSLHGLRVISCALAALTTVSHPSFPYGRSNGCTEHHELEADAGKSGCKRSPASQKHNEKTWRTIGRDARRQQREKDAAYHIDFEWRYGKNSVFIHDLRSEHEGRVAQIDHPNSTPLSRVPCLGDERL